VPLGTPLLAGAGAISAIMVVMREANTAAERVGVALGLVGVLVVLWLTLRFAGVVTRVLGQAGIELVADLRIAVDGDRGSAPRRRRAASRSRFTLAVPLARGWRSALCGTVLRIASTGG
jgi:predicted DCC family thiol-disulfide oxidoreductase YuxK